RFRQRQRKCGTPLTRQAQSGTRQLPRATASTTSSRTTNGRPDDHFSWLIAGESCTALLSSLYFLSINWSDSASFFDLPYLKRTSSRWRQKCLPSATERVVK